MHIYAHFIAVDEKETMYLKESREGFMRCFGGRKGK